MKVMAGDVGGTNTRLALIENGTISVDRRYPSAQFAGLEEIIQSFLKEAGATPSRACFGVAGPVDGDVSKLTNLSWVVDARRIEERCGIARCRVVNDFWAAALGVTMLQPGNVEQLGGSAPRATGPIVVMGAGTGLGVAFLTHDGTRYEPTAGEGGHRDFAPRDEVEIRLLRFLLTRYDHVSYERVLSGTGIKNLYDFFASESPAQIQSSTEDAMRTEDPAAVVTRLGGTGKDVLCQSALNTFISLLAAEAGNLALQVGAKGGVYLAGGIAPRLRMHLEEPAFRRSFEHKGRLSTLLHTIPVYLVMEPQLGLLGAAAGALRL